MKKLTTLLLSVVTTFAFAQNKAKTDDPTNKMDISTRKAKTESAPNATNFQKYHHRGTSNTMSTKGKTSTSTIYFSEDFSTPLASSANGAWVVSGQSGNLVSRTTAAGGPTNFQVGAIESETPGNGYVLFDFFDNIPSTDPAEAILTSPSMDLSGATGDLQVQFYQEIFTCCNFQDTMWLEFSTDGGTTWPTKFQCNVSRRNNRHWLEGYGFFFEFKLPASVKASNVKMRFNWSSLVADANGQYSNSYYWMIDDVVIREVPAHKLKFESVSGAPKQDIIFDNDGGNSKTGIMRVRDIVPITFDANLYNWGSQAQTNVDLVVEIWDPDNNTMVTSVRSNNASTVAAGDSLDFNSLTTAAWTPPSVADQYLLVYRLESTEIPSNPTSEEVADTFSFVTTFSNTSLDFQSSSNGFGTFDAGDDQSAIASRFTWKELDSTYIYGVEVFYDAGFTNPGGDIQIQIYDSTNFDLSTGFGSAPFGSKTFNITQADVDARRVLYDMTTNFRPIDIRSGSGTYYVVVYMFSNGGANRIDLLNDQTFNEPGFSSVFYSTDDSRWYTGVQNSRDFNAPLIRVRSRGDNISVDELTKANLEVFPNPSSDGIFGLTIPEAGTYTVKMNTVTGQEVESQTIKISEAGVKTKVDFSNLSKGVYIMRVEGVDSDFSAPSRVVIE